MGIIWDDEKINAKIDKEFRENIKIEWTKKWNKEIRDYCFQLVLDIQLDEVRNYLGELLANTINGKIKKEEAIKETNRIKNDLKEGGELFEVLKARTIVLVANKREEMGLEL